MNDTLKHPQIDFSPLAQMGQRIGQRRQGQQFVNRMQEALGPQSQASWQLGTQVQRPWYASGGNAFNDQQGLSRLWAGSPHGQDYGGMWSRLAGLFR